MRRGAARRGLYGPDFTAMLAAAREDPAAVARLLRLGLEADDPLAAEGFEQLARAGLAPPDAVDLLRAKASRARGDLLIRVAEALYALTRDASWARPIVGVLRGGDHWGVRLNAAIALAQFPPSDYLVDAFSRAVRDRDYLVRYRAAKTLIRYAGRHHDIGDRRDLLDKISSRSSPRGWRSVAKELRSACEV